MIIFLDKIICEISPSAKSYKKGGNKVDKADISFEKYYEDVLRFLRGLSRDEYLAEELHLFIINFYLCHICYPF